jgi:hypothetical protein
VRDAGCDDGVFSSARALPTRPFANPAQKPRRLSFFFYFFFTKVARNIIAETELKSSNNGR